MSAIPIRLRPREMPMKITLALAMLRLTAADDPETATLIQRLGSARADDRDAASAALESKGRAAWLPLRLASRDSRDAEVRTRASRLIPKIEHDLLTRPTLVTLDVRDQTIGEAIKTLGEKYHFDLTGELDAVRENLLRRLTIREEKPVPLLKALDRLCAAGGLRFGYGVDTPFAPPKFFFSNPMTFAPAGVLGPVSDAGPFRVKILSVGYTLQRFRILDRSAVQDQQRFLDERSPLLLEVLAEPRLMIKYHEDPKILEAIDDQGQSLILPPDPDDERMPSTDIPDSIFQIQINLKPRSRPGGTIRRLRGVIPVQVAELNLGPIIVPIAGSQGKSFDGPDAVVTVQSLQFDPSKGPLSIELRVRSKFQDLDVEPDKPAEPGSIPPVPDSIPYLDRQIIVLDEKGRRLYQLGNSCRWIGPKEASVSIDDSPFDEGPRIIPAKLLFYGIIRTTAEIPFAFRDIPLP